MKSSFFVDAFEKEILQRHQIQFRSLFPQERPDILNFSSLDFLNLTSLPYVKDRALHHFLRFGVGPLPSRPIAEFEKEKRISEAKLAELLGHESATFFEPTKNFFSRLLQTLITPNTLVIKCRHFPYPLMHPVETKILDPNLDNAAQLLSSVDKNRHILILLESVSSRTGKVESIDSIISLAKNLNRTVVVDDTHSMQVLGKYGMGLSCGKPGIDLILGNFGKNFGFFASYLACSQSLMDYMLNGRNPMKSKLTPFLLGIIDATLNLIPSMTIERARVLEMSKKLRKTLEISGLEKPISDTHLISVPFKTQSEMRTFNLLLADHGCIPNFINTPNVNDKPLITRLFVTSSHSINDINRLQEILLSVKPQVFCEAL